MKDILKMSLKKLTFFDVFYNYFVTNKKANTLKNDTRYYNF